MISDGHARLPLALASDEFGLPDDGRIAVFNPAAGQEFGGLDKSRLHIVQGFFPDYQHFQTLGFDCDPEPKGEYAGAVVFLPRAKAEARKLIGLASRLTGGGPVIVDGQKTGGVDSVLKDCRKAGADVLSVFAKSHGKTFLINGKGLSDLATTVQSSKVDGFKTEPGVFSADSIDPGSRLLAESLAQKLSGRVADLGAGWGYLSAEILKHDAVTECHLIEASYASLTLARANILDPRAIFYWADGRTFDDVAELDAVVSNPPFHTGRATDPQLGRDFIVAAARLLNRNGTLWLVANRQLPYEATLAGAFQSVEVVSGGPSYKIFRATRPIRKKT